MADWIIWCVWAGVMVIGELLTGTFYLLMIATGLLAGSLAAWLGLPLVWQCVIAAAIGIIATYGLRRSKLGQRTQRASAQDPNINMDIGQAVYINTWQQQGDKNTARAKYRGALWDIELAQGAVVQQGTFIIVEVRGSHLIVKNA